MVKNSYGTASEGHGRKKPLELHNNGVTQHLSRTNNDSFCTDDRHVVVVVVAVVVVVVVVDVAAVVDVNAKEDFWSKARESFFNGGQREKDRERECERERRLSVSDTVRG